MTAKNNIIILILVCFFIACSGGNDSGTNYGTAPQVIRAFYSHPSSVAIVSVDFTEGEPCCVSMEVFDPDLDITDMCISTYFPSMSFVPYETKCIGVSPQSDATVLYYTCTESLVVNSGNYGLWGTEAWVTDSQGNDSVSYRFYINIHRP